MKFSELVKVTLTFDQIERLEARTRRQGEMLSCELANALIIPQNAVGDDGKTVENVQPDLSAVLGNLAVGDIVKVNDLLSGISTVKSVQELQPMLRQLGREGFDDFSVMQTSNILMRTIYQTGLDETFYGRKLFATVIWNQAGGCVAKMPEVCLRKYQFSIWNWLDAEARTSAGFQIGIPEGVFVSNERQKIWNETKEIVEQLMNGTFSPIGSYNSYMNKSTSSERSKTTLNSMTNQKVFKDYVFGHLSRHDRL